MELQISYSICAEVPEESILWREKERDRSDIKETVRMERNQHNRGGGMSGSYTYASGDTTEDKCVKFYGIPEREKQYDLI